MPKDHSAKTSFSHDCRHFDFRQHAEMFATLCSQKINGEEDGEGIAAFPRHIHHLAPD